MSQSPSINPTHRKGEVAVPVPEHVLRELDAAVEWKYCMSDDGQWVRYPYLRERDGDGWKEERQDEFNRSKPL